MSVKETLKQLESEKTKVLMAELYGAEKAEENRARYRYVAERFEKTYGERDIKLFTSPGRVIGSVAVLGPTRMQYSKIIGMMRFMQDRLDQLLKNKE